MLHAHSLEIRKLQLSKNLSHKCVDFYVKNALKLAVRASLIPKIFPGVIPPAPVKGGGEEMGRKRRGAERREGRRKGCVMAVGGMDAPAASRD